MRRFPHQYIEFVNSSDGCMLRSNREMREAFRVHFRDPLVRLPDFPLQEFSSFLADFPRHQKAEGASCEEFVTECEVRDALK